MSAECLNISGFQSFEENREILGCCAMLPPTAIAFDLDGTLIDSRGDIVAAVNYGLSCVGLNPLPAQVIVRHLGDGARALCARAAEIAEDAEEVNEILNGFLTYYRAHPVDFTRWMPGAQEVL